MPVIRLAAVQAEIVGTIERCRAVNAASRTGEPDAVQHRCRRWAKVGDADGLCKQHRKRADGGFDVHVVPPSAPA